jgi:sterol 22-desaturase
MFQVPRATIQVSDLWRRRVFLNGKRHVDFRKGLNPLFTRQALGLYMNIMDPISRRFISEWLAECKKSSEPISLMKPARTLNMETSLRVFCGSHITEAAMEEINEKYWDITLALELVNFPFAVPGTKVYRAKQASKLAHKYLEAAVAGCRASVKAGNEPECMVEQWIHDFSAPGFKGRSDFSDLEMARVVFSFLFASQDAMSSALIYGFQHLADHPDVLEKLRAEQVEVRKGDYVKPVTMEMLDNMPYLRAVVRESMRCRPPVTMVPYTCTKAFPISEDYTVPAGSMVIPSFYNSLHDETVFPEPDKFLPERWMDENGSANSNPKNYLVFGAGPHRCIGEQYAASNTALVLANAAVLMNWEHVRTSQSDEIE